MQLQIKNPNIDFKVNEITGEAYVSQTKLGELCGVRPHAISQYVSKARDTLKLNENNQLHEDSVELVIAHYAFDSQRPTEQALKTYRIMAKAGIRAYIYKQAGYEIKVEKAQVPQTYIQALEALISSEKEKERISLERDSLLIQLDESKEWMSIKKVANHNHISWREISWAKLKRADASIVHKPKSIFDANYGKVNAYHTSAWEEIYPELEIPLE